jgi:hypothetical protein
MSNNPELLRKLQEYTANHPRVDVPEHLLNIDNPQPNLSQDYTTPTPYENIEYFLNYFGSEHFNFYQYAGMSVFFNTLWLFMILSVLLFNNIISKTLISDKIHNKYGKKLFKFYTPGLAPRYPQGRRCQPRGLI